MDSMVRKFYIPGSGTAGDLRRGGRALGEKTVNIGTINVNAPNADASAVANKIPTAIKDRLELSQAQIGMFS